MCPTKAQQQQQSSVWREDACIKFQSGFIAKDE